MKSVIAAVGLSLLASVHAQSDCIALAAKVPSCVNSCLSSVASSCSGPTDLACICEKAQAQQDQLALCVVKSCSSADALKAESAATDVCTCVASAPKAAAASPAAASSAPAAPVASKAAAAAPVSSPAAAMSSAHEPATAATAAPATASSAAAPVAAQIGDGQVQSSNITSNNTAPITPFMGAATKTVLSSSAVVAVVMGVVLAAM